MGRFLNDVSLLIRSVDDAASERRVGLGKGHRDAWQRQARLGLSLSR